MKRLLSGLISLYPKTWRNRYECEYVALLDEVGPTWKTLFDVFGGAVKMQLKSWSAWKIITAFALVGGVGSLAFSLTIPNRYVSTAVLKADNVNVQLQKVLSRASLSLLINKEDLYKGERTHMPMEEVIEQMKRQDVAVRR